MANSLKRKRGPLSVPTTQPLPNGLRIPASSPFASKTLSKLSRSALLELATEWCKEENLKTCGPYLSSGEEADEDPEAPYTAAESIDEVQELYSESLSRRKGTKREVLDHILEGDWRHGISLQQLAMAETQHVVSHPNALRWAAMRLQPASSKQTANAAPSRAHLPPFQPHTFALALHAAIAPLAKAHYHVARPATLPLTLLRVALHDTPYATQRAFAAQASAAARSLFIAFPAHAPFVYVSLPAAGDDDDAAHPLLRLVVDAIPAALSPPGQAWSMHSTGLVARSLGALLAMRGPGRANNAQGGWGVYADEEEQLESAPVEYGRSEGVEEGVEEGEGKENEERRVKRRFEHSNPSGWLDGAERKKLRDIAQSRFGPSAQADDGMGLQRFDVSLNDVFVSGGVGLAAFASPDSSSASLDRSIDDAGSKPWKPNVKLSFQGAHVFAGIRALVESGIVDGTRMPGWMTGEASMSNGVVKNGRLDSRKAGI